MDYIDLEFLKVDWQVQDYYLNNGEIYGFFIFPNITDCILSYNKMLFIPEFIGKQTFSANILRNSENRNINNKVIFFIRFKDIIFELAVIFKISIHFLQDNSITVNINPMKIRSFHALIRINGLSLKDVSLNISQQLNGLSRCPKVFWKYGTKKTILFLEDMRITKFSCDLILNIVKRNDSLPGYVLVRNAEIISNSILNSNYYKCNIYCRNLQKDFNEPIELELYFAKVGVSFKVCLNLQLKILVLDNAHVEFQIKPLSLIAGPSNDFNCHIMQIIPNQNEFKGEIKFELFSNLFVSNAIKIEFQ